PARAGDRLRRSALHRGAGAGSGARRRGRRGRGATRRSTRSSRAARRQVSAGFSQHQATPPSASCGGDPAEGGTVRPGIGGELVLEGDAGGTREEQDPWLTRARVASAEGTVRIRTDPRASSQ